MSSEKKEYVLDKPVGLYDGACKMCVDTTKQLRELDKEGVIEWLNLHDEAVRRRFPNIDWARAEEEMHLIHRDGRIHTGARAVADVAALIGGETGRAAAKAMELPVIRDAAELAYKIVSANRYKVK